MTPPGAQPNQSQPTRYSGLLPHKGWPGRNLKFFRHRIVPGMFRRPAGAAVDPVLEPPGDDRVRITWIGHASFFLQFAGHSVMIDPNATPLVAVTLEMITRAVKTETRIG